MDLATLFEVRSSPWPGAPYTSLEAELQAVASRKKGMSMHLFPGAAIADDAGYLELMNMALGLGLGVFQQPDATHPRHAQVRVFVLYPDEMWRMQAFTALWKILPEHGWTVGAEALEGYLLGYTEDQIAAWKAYKHWFELPHGKTVLLWMSQEQKAFISALGNKCIPPDSLDTGITAFYGVGAHVLKKSARALVGGRAVVGRISMDRTMLEGVLGPTGDLSGRSYVSSVLRSDVATQLNLALRSEVQFLDPGGWS